VTVLLDSFAELDKLERQAAKFNVRVRAGIRVTTVESGIWRKFGIPLDQLAAFFTRARSCRYVHLCGIQFHLSWNLNARAHVRFITRLGGVLREFKPRRRERIEFIDIGGGYWPSQGEWLQAEATPLGKLRQALGRPTDTDHRHYRLPAASITEFAEQIAAALQQHLPGGMNYTIYAEPGRWLCHDAMHILLRVLDRKSESLVITDGGINAVGWERYEHDYFPVINLSRPGLEERECLVAGSLCTPHDIWGYNYFGDDIQPGDVLLVPFQGAYTYSLKQEFIKPLPRSVELASAAAEVLPQDALVAGTGEV
jgi:diaminopimelate decarboxylase